MNPVELLGKAASEDPVDSQSGVEQERIIPCVSLSGGVALGRPCFYRTPAAGESRNDGSPAEQSSRLRRALLEVSRHYSQLAEQADDRLNRLAGDIFRAQFMLTRDPSLIAALERRLSARYASAESVVTDTLDSFASELLSAQSDDIRERACDITELKHSLLMYLDSKNGYVNCRDSSFCRYGECQNGHAHILVATQFMPGAALSASRFTRGFVVEKGGPSSHAAILARMMGLPAVSGAAGFTAALSRDCNILIDGDCGRLYINPSAATLKEYNRKLVHARSGSHNPAVSSPVKGFRILADIDRVDDIPEARSVRAEGIGLYRSESEVLLKQDLLTEEEQFDRYSTLLDAMPDAVCIRLLDLGSDKSAEWLNLPAEENPALGCRGARLLLQRPQLLQTQARALARASRRGRINVLYPMVQSVRQYLELRELFDTAIEDIADADLSHGVMFEVPAACLEATEFYKHVDFGRIGTNDLTQYLFASDRMNGSLQRDDLYDEPALWHLIDTVAAAAYSAGKPVSMCGELVIYPRYIGRMLAAGISEISTSPQYISCLRQAANRLLVTPENYCCSENGQYSFLEC